MVDPDGDTEDNGNVEVVVCDRDALMVVVIVVVRREVVLVRTGTVVFH